MPLVNKSFVFSDPADDMPDGGNAANIIVSRNASEPSIQTNCSVRGITQTEFATISSGNTWEDWGVPSGATVSSVRFTTWTDRVANNTRLGSHSVVFSIVDNSGNSILSSIITSAVLPNTTAASFSDEGSTSLVNVIPASQSPTSVARLRFEYTLNTTAGGGSANVSWRFGSATLEINYTIASENNNVILLVTPVKLY